MKADVILKKQIFYVKSTVDGIYYSQEDFAIPKIKNSEIVQVSRLPRK